MPHYHIRGRVWEELPLEERRRLNLLIHNGKASKWIKYSNGPEQALRAAGLALTDGARA